MQEYCLSRDDLDFVLSVTKVQGQGGVEGGPHGLCGDADQGSLHPHL